MNFEILKRSHLKRNIIIGVIFVAIISAIVLNFTRAKYRVTESIPLVNGTINYTPYDFKIIAMYQANESGGYDSINEVPASGYILNEKESYCKVNDVRDDSISLSFDVNTKGLSITPMTTKGTQCYLYFDKYSSTIKESILKNHSTLLTRNDFNVAITETTTGTIYYSTDDDGITYYFAGNPTDNWIKFAGFYWRIIRINGDGTLRIIYSGKSQDATGDNSSIQLSEFNNAYTDNKYVGFEYASGEIHGAENESTVLEVLNIWYQNNLLSYANYIDVNAGFCGDRTPSTSETVINNSGGIGNVNTYYAPYIRLITNKAPTYNCNNNTDLYTMSNASKGNKTLTNPIGLISADEVAFAGGVSNINNTDYYLYTKGSYWTISPYFFYNNKAYVYYVDWVSGKLSYFYVNSNAIGIRPVINLKANVQISSGNGTASNPYIVT